MDGESQLAIDNSKGLHMKSTPLFVRNCFSQVTQ